MIDKKSIIKMANHVFHRSQGYADRRLIHPQRDWVIGMGVFATAVLVGSITAGNVFVTYRNISDADSDLIETTPAYKEMIVNSTLEEYRLRAQEQERLRGSKVPVIVPEVASSTVKVVESEEGPTERQGGGVIEEAF